MSRRRAGPMACFAFAAAFFAAFLQTQTRAGAPSPASRPQTQASVDRVQTPLGTAWRVAADDPNGQGTPWGQALSPDGRHVAFFMIRDARPGEYLKMRNDLVVCSTDGNSRWTALDGIPNNCAKMHLVPRIVWSADGNGLCCVNNESPTGMGPVRLWWIDVPSRKARDLGTFLKDLTYVVMRVALGPDGRSVVLASSDHRLHQVDTGHNFFPIVIVGPDGNEVRTKENYKDALASPLGGLVAGIQLVKHELHRISPSGEANMLYAFDKGQFTVRVHLAGETGNVLLVTGGNMDRRAWKPMIGFRNEPVFTVRLIAPEGNSVVVQEKALQDSIVPLPQDDTVLVAETEKPYVQHPFAGTREELDLTGPLRAMPGPSAKCPYAVLQPVKDLGGGRMEVQSDQTFILNWKTRKVHTLKDRPFDDVRLPASWSEDGKWLAFSRAPGKGEPVPVPRLVDPPYEFTAGEIWVLRLGE